MTDVESKRAYLAGLYGGPRRWRRIVAKMPDDQVLAIYMKEQKKSKHDPVEIEEPKHFNLPPRPPHENEDQFPMY
jgi:hypothetical protein